MKSQGFSGLSRIHWGFLGIPGDYWGLGGENHRASQDFGGFCLNPLDSPGFFENCTRFLACRAPWLLSCVIFNYFVGVKQGALGIARTGTGKFCPGSSGIPFSIQVVEQKEPPSTFHKYCEPNDCTHSQKRFLEDMVWSNFKNFQACRLNDVRFGPDHILIGPEKALLQNKKIQTDKTTKQTGRLNYSYPLSSRLNSKLKDIAIESSFSKSPISLVYTGCHWWTVPEDASNNCLVF